MKPEEVKKIALFSRLKEASLVKIGSIARDEKFDAGSTIFSEGEPGDKLFLIIEGQVRISKMVPNVGEEALAILDEGNWFGEMALIDEGPRSADAKANTACRLATISTDDFWKLLSEDKDLAVEVLREMLKTMSLRLRETNEKIKTFFILSSLF